MNDSKVTFGHKKLRWPSIIDAEAYKEKVIILQRVYGGINNLFISDPVKGICVHINPSLYKNILINKIKIVGDKLVYYSDDKSGSIDIPTIINQDIN
jgi:hypothetical protein